MTYKTIGGLLCVVLMTGCADNTLNPTRSPQLEEHRDSTQYQGQLSCPSCPTGKVTLTLLEATPLSPPSYRLREGDAAETNGTVFEIDGNTRYPDQTLYELVAPVTQRVMTVMPAEDGGLRVLQYRGTPLDTRNIVFKRIQQ